MRTVWGNRRRDTEHRLTVSELGQSGFIEVYSLWTLGPHIGYRVNSGTGPIYSNLSPGRCCAAPFPSNVGRLWSGVQAVCSRPNATVWHVLRRSASHAMAVVQRKPLAIQARVFPYVELRLFIHVPVRRGLQNVLCSGLRIFEELYFKYTINRADIPHTCVCVTFNERLDPIRTFTHGYIPSMKFTMIYHTRYVYAFVMNTNTTEYVKVDTFHLVGLYLYLRVIAKKRYTSMIPWQK